jgi:tRNA-dihydrouridine synthase 1
LNPIGARCDYELCKKCCKQECYELKKNCQGHQWWFGDRNGLREMMEAKKRAMSMAAKMGDSL